MKKFLPIGFAFYLFTVLFGRQTAYAHHHLQVLGDSTISTKATIPPTVEGPGLLSPDSPFYFLDELKQNIRLAFSFSPEQKAKVYSEVAGERMAELRFMLEKDDKDAASVALRGVSSNFYKSAQQLAQAQFNGKDVKELANQINDSIKTKQHALDNLEVLATSDFTGEVRAAQDKILSAKVMVDDGLPDDLISNEIKDDLKRLISRKVRDASNSARELQDQIDQLNQLASESAQIAKVRQEEFLKKEVGNNETVKKIEAKRLEMEVKRQDQLFALQKKQSEEAIKSVQQVQKAAAEFDSTFNQLDEIQKQPINVELTPTPSQNPSSSKSLSSLWRFLR